jgi:hypothetical protein
MNRLFTALVLGAVLAITAGCNVGSFGGGSESTGICGTVEYRNQRMAKVKIYLIKSDTVAIVDSTATDAEGRFSFQDNLTEPLYSLQGSKDSLSFVRFNLPPDTTVAITLQRTGTLRCTFRLEDDTNCQDIFVFLPGTSFDGRTDRNGNIVMSYLPPGIYELIAEKDRYLRCDSVQVEVRENSTVIVDTITLRRDPDAPPPAPKKLRIDYDTLSGIINVSWNSDQPDIGQYGLHIYDPKKSNNMRDGELYTLFTSEFTDTLFLTPSEFAEAEIRLKFQVEALGSNGLSSGYTPFAAGTFPRPTTPPAPKCSLKISDSQMIIGIFTSVLPAAWIDSIRIYRAIIDTMQPDVAATLPRGNPETISYDTVRGIPKDAPGTVKIFYCAQVKSVTGKWSACSPVCTTSLENPYEHYSIAAPSRPAGPPADTTAGSFNVLVSPIASPIKNDHIEYRICIVNTSSDDTSASYWYAYPSIDISLSDTGTYIIRCQARSGLLPNLMSELSPGISVRIHQFHSVSKPMVPAGNDTVRVSTMNSYLSGNLPACNFSHPVAIRYSVFFQTSATTDTTGWISPPEKPTSILMGIPGSAYIRAQTRCIEDTLIVSPWSDALVVTVQ